MIMIIDDNDNDSDNDNNNKLTIAFPDIGSQIKFWFKYIAGTI